MSAIRPYESGGMAPLQAADIRAQVNLIQSVMREVMKDNHHYGVIPGCDKPALLKPGAEKLAMTFRLRPIIDPDRDVRIIDLGGDHREVQCFCHIYSSDGVEVATGVGTCSTRESKYRYRGGEKTPTGQPVPTDYWNLKGEDPSKALELIGGRGYGVGKFDGTWQVCILGEKQENPDPANEWNTVLKMSKKRAFIDGILSATAASDIFTQDIVDDDEVKDVAAKPAPPAPAVTMPARKSAPAQAPSPSGPETVLTIDRVSVKSSGPDDAKVWKKYGLKMSDGEWYSTFDIPTGEAAEQAKAAGHQVAITYHVDGKGFRNIDTLTVIEPAEPGANG